MAVPFVLGLLQVFIVRGTDRLYHLPPGTIARGTPAERLLRHYSFIRDVASLIWAGGTMVCLELGLHYGASRSWGTPLVIGLLAGSGGGLLVFILTQRSLAARLLPFNKLTRQGATVMLFAFLWGVSYYSFSYYIRKSLRYILIHLI